MVSEKKDHASSLLFPKFLNNFEILYTFAQ